VGVYGITLDSLTKDLSEEERRALMLKTAVTIQYGSITALAKRLGYSRQLVSYVISGMRRNKKIQVAIADAVGVPAESLFGDEDLAA